MYKRIRGRGGRKMRGEGEVGEEGVGNEKYERRFLELPP